MLNALQAWDKIARRIAGKNLFLFLDFDGTLAPIVRTPQEAALPQKTKILLERFLSRKKIRLAVVSGRSVQDVKKRLGIKNMIYAGHHGLEISSPGLRRCFGLRPRFARDLRRVKRDAMKKLSQIQGVLFEDKGNGFAVHYRQVSREKVAAFKKEFFRAVQPFVSRKKVVLKKGKKVFDVMPPFLWNKGKAVLWLLKTVKSGGRGPVEAVYIGDDVTDEDAFRTLKGRGISIKVGGGKRTSADYSLKNTGQVVCFLRKLEALRRSDESID